MIFPRHPIVYVAKAAVDLRCGFDKLALLVTEQFGKSPRDGALFVFMNKAKTRLKILFVDPFGMWLVHRRLDRGTFPLPATLDPHATHIAVSAEELTRLVQGLETGRARRIRRTPPLH